MIQEKLANGLVMGDGGIIFELERRGYVSAGPFTPEAVLDNPDAVLQVQIDFARAGAEVLQAAAYYAHEDKLKTIGRAGILPELNREAVNIAHKAGDEFGCMVAGDLANTWVYDPASSASDLETRRQFDLQIENQAPHGVDFFIAETIEYLGEALIALQAIRDAGFPAMITMGFKVTDKTLDGYELEEAFKRLEDAGAEIVGINCFRDPEHMLPLAQRVRSAVSCFLATQPVGFRCNHDKPFFQAQTRDGRIAFPLEMDPFYLTRIEMADYAAQAAKIGVDFIGACCGTGPHHLRSMAEALGRTPPASKYSPQLKLHTIIGDAEHLRERDQRILCESTLDDAICHFKTKEDP